ncbi:MAG: serine/threonine protein kinase [Phycisphaeraceae bacterium]|nr:MAG: serine/threonine protein kinase [Phycisphaeraceae bacterium]
MYAARIGGMTSLYRTRGRSTREKGPGMTTGDNDPTRADAPNGAVPSSENPTAPDTPGAARAPEQGPLPESIGSYRILSRLGAGGMGVVYEAEQEHPKRAVALKVINPGLLSGQALRRFEHEAEVLGRLQHPGIAQIYEAGTFDLGGGNQPYFAMELVRGETLTAYAHRKQLGTRERLALVVKICRAVHHAHTKGIVHRDLKPGNILVTAEGEPKILDFGVARATDADIQTTSLRTDVGQLVGTLPYMSPEQASGDPGQIDTRSDVYALGVVAYELLAGRLPYDVAKKMVHEAVRIIREDEPTRLSSISRTLRGDVEIIVGKALEKEKERRYQSALDLASDIERYLNDEPIEARPPSSAYQLRKFARRNKALVGGAAAVIIVLVAGVIGTTTYAVRAEAARVEAIAAREAEAEQRRIAEEREAEALAAREAEAEQRRIAEESERRAVEEAERALAAEAEAQQRAKELELVADFQAGQLSGIDSEAMGVNLRRGVIDKRRAFLEGRGMDEEEIAAALAELESSLTGVNFTNVALGTLDENIFERALTAIDEQFADQPLIKARLLQTIAATLRAIGLLDRATQPQVEALEIRRRILGDEHPSTLTSIESMGGLLQNQGKLAEAEPYFREALEVSRRVLGDEHPDTLVSIGNMGGQLWHQGKLIEAEPYYRERLEVSRRVLGDEHPDTLTSFGSMGLLLQTQGRLAEAEPYYREALEGHRRTLGDEHPFTLISTNNMGGLLRQQGRLAEAEPYHREALEGSRRVLGDEHPDTLTSISNMGALLWHQGKLAEAEPYLREALEVSRRVLGDEHPDMFTSIHNMGFLLQAQGKLAEAEPYLREALESRRRVLGDEHPSTLGSLNSMGWLLWQQGKLAEAEPYYREAVEGHRRVLGDEHPHTLTSINNMGALLRDLGKLKEAERLGAEAVETARRILPKVHWHTAVVLDQHARTLAAMERYAEAEVRYLEAAAILESALGPQHERTTDNIRQLADLYTAWREAEPDAGHDAKAAEWRAKLNEPEAPAVVTEEES